MNPFEFRQGNTPLLISIPHAGTGLTPEVRSGLASAAQGLCDTDWHLPQLYEFADEVGASLLVANYSRFVIDLNRPPDDKPLYNTATTGLWPETLFDGTPIFRPGKGPTAEQRQQYLSDIWQPYHTQLQDELARIKARFGYARLFDAQSIASVIPRLFAGKLPDLNLGTNAGVSCSPLLGLRLQEVCEAQSDFSWVVNGRFKGGYITRAYGQPAEGIEAVQLELAQCNYMEEAPPFDWDSGRALRVQPLLKKLVTTFLS